MASIDFTETFSVITSSPTTGSWTEIDLTFFLGDDSNYVTKNDLSKGIQMAKESFITCNIRRSLQNTPKVLSKPKRDLVINTDDITNLRIELNRADISFNNFLERV